MIGEGTRLAVLDFPSNPTGGVATREDLESLADVILRRAPRNARVTSDEVYEDVLFDGAQLFTTLDINSRCSSSSGTLSPRWTENRSGGSDARTGTSSGSRSREAGPVAEGVGAEEVKP